MFTKVSLMLVVVGLLFILVGLHEGVETMSLLGVVAPGALGLFLLQSPERMGKVLATTSCALFAVVCVIWGLSPILSAKVALIIAVGTLLGVCWVISQYRERIIEFYSSLFSSQK